MGRLSFPIFALVCALALTVSANQVHDKTYKTLNGKASCTRLMNDHEQIGCQSPRKGASGVLFKIDDASDVNVLLYSAPKDEYVPLIAYSVFSKNTSIAPLLRSDLITGMLVYDDSSSQGLSFSPDSVLPNANEGLPYGTQGTPNVNWNPVGGGFNRFQANFSEGLMFLDFDVPIFYLTSDDNATVFSCYNAHNQIVNGVLPKYPQCGIELNSFMWGAGDSRTCMRRALCDALSNQSPYGYLRSPNATEEVVMVTAKLDSSAFFHDLSYGAEADASGLIVALAAAELLGRTANNASRSLPRNIMFSLFHGEAFGYIGSSRMAWDMNLNNNPLPLNKVSHFVELGQLALVQSNTVHVHSFNSNSAKVVQAKDALTAASASLTGPTINALSATELPPASLRAFLQEMSGPARTAFGGVVLTDYDATGFENQAFHSHLDKAANIQFADNSSAVVTQLCTLSAVVAKSAWMLAANTTSITMPDTAADCALVASLLQCLTKDQSCPLVASMVGSVGPAGSPMSRYIGVANGGLDRSTYFLLNVLAWALASNRNASIDAAACVPVNRPPSPQPYRLRNGACVLTNTYSWPALSPAFYADGSNLRPSYNPRYSTWTEARWGSVSMRIFLVDSPSAQATILGGGVIMLVFCFALVYGMQKVIVVSPRT
eukprot:m.225766 g.225766  ORF g.225766 m.225766 type:complete len:660 (+) comp16783_c0_seq1:38-2017(+)